MPYLVALVGVGFLLWCVLDVALCEAAEVRNLPKLVWLVLVVVLPPLGGVAWLVAGRPEGGGFAPGGSATRAARGRHPSSHRPTPQSPRGPDDDPDFLRRLDEQLRNDDD